MVCDWELAEARKKDALDRARVRGEEPPPELLAEERGLHSSIETDVKNLLEGKTYGELEALQSQIESQMRSGTAKVVEYWEAVLKRLHIYKAKVFIIRCFFCMSFTLFSKLMNWARLTIVFHMQACLKEIHTKKLHEHLVRLEEPLEDDEEHLEQEVKMGTDYSIQVKADDDEHDIEGMVQRLYFATLNFLSQSLIYIFLFPRTPNIFTRSPRGRI